MDDLISRKDANDTFWKSEVEFRPSQIDEVLRILNSLPSVQPEITRCKDCKFYEVKDYWGEFGGMPVLAASDRPTCTRWGSGDCATFPDGYCYLAERGESNG